MDVKSKPRRRHSAQFKAEVIAACAEPDASVAAVARRFALNDNLVHQWRRGRGVGVVHRRADAHAPPAEFVALSLPAPASPPSPPVSTPTESIIIELKRGPTAVNVRWPMSAATDCAAWLRELLR
jgi:transposase